MKKFDRYEQKLKEQGEEKAEKIAEKIAISKSCKSACNVRCPNCGGVFFETTDQYDPIKLVTPNMIKLLDKYADWGWAEVIPDNSAGFGALVCPECESLIAPEGRLTLIWGNYSDIDSDNSDNEDF